MAFLPATQASVHAGQLALQALFGQFGPWEKIRQAPALDPRIQSRKGIDPGVYY